MHNDDSPLADTEVHYLHSDCVGDEFKIFVGHCGAAPESVLFLTDANGFFGTAVDLVRVMQLERHLPSLLVIGIGYRMGTLFETTVIRTRDLTPTVDEEFAAYVPEQRETGGAPNLRAFIRDELMPWVGARFGVDPARGIYFGHSFGGLFGIDVLLSEPDTFASYVIGSPSLWWQHGVMFEREAVYAATHDDLAARVFLGVGADEDHAGRLREVSRMPAKDQEFAQKWNIDMVRLMQRMVHALETRDYPNLVLESTVFADEFHSTVPALHLTRGLRFVLDAPH